MIMIMIMIIIIIVIIIIMIITIIVIITTRPHSLEILGRRSGGIANHLMARKGSSVLAGNLPKHGVTIKILREKELCRKAYLNMNEVFC